MYESNYLQKQTHDLHQQTAQQQRAFQQDIEGIRNKGKETKEPETLEERKGNKEKKKNATLE